MQLPAMQLRVGYELIYNCPQPVPMILLVNVHYSRASDLVVPERLTTEPSVPVTGYRDSFGNWCNRLTAPAGRLRIRGEGVVRDSGQPDAIVPDAAQHSIEELPAETLVFLLGSRYCETDLLSETAWQLFQALLQVGARSGNLRLCPRPDLLRLSGRSGNPHCNPSL